MPIGGNNGFVREKHTQARTSTHTRSLCPPPLRLRVRADVHDSEARRASRGRTVLRHPVPRHKVKGQNERPLLLRLPEASEKCTQLRLQYKHTRKMTRPMGN